MTPIFETSPVLTFFVSRWLRSPRSTLPTLSRPPLHALRCLLRLFVCFRFFLRLLRGLFLTRRFSGFSHFHRPDKEPGENAPAEECVAKELPGLGPAGGPYGQGPDPAD